MDWKLLGYALVFFSLAALVATGVVGPSSKPPGISQESAEVAKLGGRLIELHPRDRHDVVCFAIKSYDHDVVALSCVKETPIEVELRKQR